MLSGPLLIKVLCFFCGARGVTWRVIISQSSHWGAFEASGLLDQALPSVSLGLLQQ